MPLPTTKPPSPTPSSDHHHGRKPSRCLHVSSQHSTCLFLTILVQLTVLFLITHPSTPPPPPISATPPPSSISATIPPAEPTCPNGRVYIYNLPPSLNKDLIDNCQDLDPWSSRCAALSNSGFGPQAESLNDVVPRDLTPAWYWTDMYAAEVIYHDRMLHYKCGTPNQDDATAFYIPFYVGLAVGKYLWLNYTSKDRDYHSVQMLNWVKDQEPWKRSNGSDHFIMLGRLTWDFRRLTDDDREWGTRFLYMPLMKNVLHLAVERSRWDQLEISVPYPTAFHPRSQSDVATWQRFIRARKRSSLFTFVGATRKKIKNDFRGVLMNYCKSEPGLCRVVDCSVARCYDGAPAILESFLDSDFCLQPKGDGYTRRSAFDCMLAGSIPVYFWRESTEHQYEWHLPKDASSISVLIHHAAARNNTSIIKKVLEGYSRDRVVQMREKIIHLLPRLLYARSDTDLGDVNDAFDVAMEGVLKMFKRQKQVAALQAAN